ITFYNIESILGVFGRYTHITFHFICGRETKPNFRAPVERDTSIIEIDFLENGLKTEKSEENLC
ncbi:MAG: hypothetical protein ACTSVZ_07565, partial [Promethearchaeota archaeon]